MNIETAVTEAIREMRAVEPGEEVSDRELIEYVRRTHTPQDAREHETSFLRRAYSLVIGATDAEVAEVLDSVKVAVGRVVRDYMAGDFMKSTYDDRELIDEVRGNVTAEYVRSIGDAELRRAYALVAGAKDAEIDAALA